MENQFQTATFAALAIVAQTQIEQIQQIRQKHDPAYQRWPPHINLIFPFVNPKHFQQIYKELAELFADFQSFQIKFTQIGYFANNGTVYLVPDAQQKKIHEVYTKICQKFPQLKDKRQFVPHMTVGKFKKGEAQKNKNDIQFKWQQWNIQCKGIHILSRGKDTPMKTAHFIKFKTK